jgi:hypothetical protein
MPMILSSTEDLTHHDVHGEDEMEINAKLHKRRKF